METVIVKPHTLKTDNPLKVKFQGGCQSFGHSHEYTPDEGWGDRESAARNITDPFLRRVRKPDCFAPKCPGCVFRDSCRNYSVQKYIP